ncbi:MAG: glycerate kinase [Bacteroidia bacterium]|nr:glycerate kinase [Bacteroidia bacterium]
MKQVEEVIEIYHAGVESVLPVNLVRKSVNLHGTLLTCQSVSLNLSDFRHIYLLGFGKASAAMAVSLEELLGDSVTGGHVLTKYGHAKPLKKCTLTEAGHPIPDQNGVDGTLKIREFAELATAEDLLIILISGGGSALLTDLPEGITLKQLAVLNKLLVNSGAGIQEINSVRKHLSQIKGGQLARFACPAKVLTLLISDVAGDPLDVIASGPTVADPSTFNDAIEVLEKYHLTSSVSVELFDYLKKGQSGHLPETVKESDPGLLNCTNIILGNNYTALEGAKARAVELGYETLILTNRIEGDVNQVADYIYSEIKSSIKSPGMKKRALLFGGEPTVQHHGNGKGGRNQHLALLMAQKIDGVIGITFLSAGTDGTDGPTDAAGAICNGTTIRKAKRLNLNPVQMANDFNSYPFFEATGGLLRTGPTYTNVMDLIVVLIDK